MKFSNLLQNVLGRAPTRSEIAGDLADRLSAMELLRGNARLDGDIPLLEEATAQTKAIKAEVREHQFDRNEYPGLYR